MRKIAAVKEDASLKQKTEKEKSRSAINCNVCEIVFHPNGKYDRFCAACKNKSKLFHFSEWLPEHCLMA